jgi:hypothetical protein
VDQVAAQEDGSKASSIGSTDASIGGLEGFKSSYKPQITRKNSRRPHETAGSGPVSRSSDASSRRSPRRTDTSTRKAFAKGSPAPFNHKTSDTVFESTLMRRSDTIRRLQRIIQAEFGSQYTVQAFGSTEYGVDNFKSDLDLVLLVSTRIWDSAPTISYPRLCQ